MSIPGQTVTVIPSVLFRDANAGIEWLKSIFGFTEHAVYRNAAGAVEHAELLLGKGILMVGTAGLNPQSVAWMGLPEECGGKNTGVVYLIIKDCTSVWQQALNAGAGDPAATPRHGLRWSGLHHLRPEGHVWSVGEYDPWAAPAAQR